MLTEVRMVNHWEVTHPEERQVTRIIEVLRSHGCTEVREPGRSDLMATWLSCAETSRW